MDAQSANVLVRRSFNAQSVCPAGSVNSRDIYSLYCLFEQTRRDDLYEHLPNKHRKIYESRFPILTRDDFDEWFSNLESHIKASHLDRWIRGFHPNKFGSLGMGS